MCAPMLITCMHVFVLWTIWRLWNVYPLEFFWLILSWLDGLLNEWNYPSDWSLALCSDTGIYSKPCSIFPLIFNCTIHLYIWVWWKIIIDVQARCTTICKVVDISSIWFGLIWLMCILNNPFYFGDIYIA